MANTFQPPYLSFRYRPTAAAGAGSSSSGNLSPPKTQKEGAALLGYCSIRITVCEYKANAKKTEANCEALKSQGPKGKEEEEVKEIALWFGHGTANAEASSGAVQKPQAQNIAAHMTNKLDIVYGADVKEVGTGATRRSQITQRAQTTRIILYEVVDAGSRWIPQQALTAATWKYEKLSAVAKASRKKLHVIRGQVFMTNFVVLHVRIEDANDSTAAAPNSEPKFFSNTTIVLENDATAGTGKGTPLAALDLLVTPQAVSVVDYDVSEFDRIKVTMKDELGNIVRPPAQGDGFKQLLVFENQIIDSQAEVNLMQKNMVLKGLRVLKGEKLVKASRLVNSLGDFKTVDVQKLERSGFDPDYSFFYVGANEIVAGKELLQVYVELRNEFNVKVKLAAMASF